jgi:deoxyribonuclease-4
MNWYGLHVTKPTHIHPNTPLTALAFFLGNPRGWKMKGYEGAVATRIRKTLHECKNLSPEQIAIHGCYLINLAAENPEVLAKSRVRIVEELNECEKLGLLYYVLHPGVCKDHGKGLRQFVSELDAVLSQTSTVMVLIENMTGTNKLCETWDEIQYILDHTQYPRRVGVCLDTAHCWGAGMNMMTVLDDFDQAVGLQHLKVIHLNDSKAVHGSHRDLHANIQEGNIPKAFFPQFVNDPRTHNIPTILETPKNCHGTISALITTVQ